MSECERLRAEVAALREWGQAAYRFVEANQGSSLAGRLIGEGQNLALDPVSVAHGRKWASAASAVEDGSPKHP